MFLLGGSPTTRRDITTTYQMTTDHSVNADEPKAVHFLGNPAARHASRVRYTPRIEPTPRIARNTDLKSQPPPFPPTKPGHIPTPTIVTTGLAKDTHDGLEQRSAHHEPSTPQKGLGKLDRNNRSAGHRVVRSSAGNPNSDETLEKSRYKLPKALAIFQKRSKSEDLDSNALSERSPLRSSSYSSSHRIVETSVIYSKNESQDTVISPTGEPEHAQGRVNQYHILKDIGIGAFGRVTLVRSELTAKYYACKVISKNRLRKKFRWTQGGKPSPQSPTPTSGIDDELMASIKREVAVLKKLSEHPNIVNLVEVLDDAMEDNLYIIFDLCEYGPVMEITVGEPTRPLSEELARKYFRDVVLGLEYLHYKRIIHRDIKPENLLRTAENVVQIGDFGISHMFDDGDNEGLLVSKNGSPLYSPPEACSAETKVLNGKSLDIWSLGVTLYCFVHGTCPWEDTNIVELCRKICQDDYTTLDCLSNDLKDLLSKMMDKNPNTRIQMSQIKIHPWVTENGRDPLLSTDANCVYEDVTEEEVAHAFRPALRFVNKMMKKLKSRSKTSKHKHPTVSPNTREYTDKNLATPKTSARTFSAIAKGGPVLSEPNLRQHGQDQSNSDLSSRGSVQRRSVGDCEADLAEDFQNRTRQLLFDIDYGDGSITWSNYMSVDLSMAAALNHNSSVNTSHTHAFDSNSKSANQSHKQGHVPLQDDDVFSTQRRGVDNSNSHSEHTNRAISYARVTATAPIRTKISGGLIGAVSTSAPQDEQRHFSYDASFSLGNLAIEGGDIHLNRAALREKTISKLHDTTLTGQDNQQVHASVAIQAVYRGYRQRKQLLAILRKECIDLRRRCHEKDVQLAANTRELEYKSILIEQFSKSTKPSKPIECCPVVSRANKPTLSETPLPIWCYSHMGAMATDGQDRLTRPDDGIDIMLNNIQNLSLEFAAVDILTDDQSVDSPSITTFPLSLAEAKPLSIWAPACQTLSTSTTSKQFEPTPDNHFDAVKYIWASPSTTSTEIALSKEYYGQNEYSGDMCAMDPSFLFKYAPELQHEGDTDVRVAFRVLVDKIIKTNDQPSSIYLQQRLKSDTMENRAHIFDAVYQQVISLMKNRFGNFLTIDCVDEDVKMTLITELLQSIPETFTHRFACHVAEDIRVRLDRRAAQYYIEPIIQEIFSVTAGLAKGQWGNWVIQHIIENGSPEQRSHVLEVVSQNVFELSTDQFASKVVEKCIKLASKNEAHFLIEKIIEPQPNDQGRPHLLGMMNNQYANYVVQNVLNIADSPHRDTCIRILTPHLSVLRGSKYGQRVASMCEKSMRMANLKYGTPMTSIASILN
ncbi:hypothetical protein BSLG_006883 [Batrachochytrium salamandrivorans]|nr:hypothetical protein BSLG_006883 [Batrachochytrium salamandrivorans]